MGTEKKNEMMVSRRTVLKVGAAAAGTAAFLAACGTSGSSTSPSPKPSQSDTISDVVNVANWTLYIDLSEDELARPTVTAFETEYSTKVNYVEAINDNDSFFGTIQAPLKAGEDTGWDIATLTDWMAARIIRLGWAEKLKTAHMSNFTANLLDVYKGRSFDPSVEYLAPWAGIVGGIAANKTTAGFVKGFKDLFDPRLKGKVSLLTEMRDTIGLAMLANGDDPAKADRASFDRAIALIEPSVADGTVRAFTGNDYKELIVKGDVAACVAWRGDVVQIGYEDANIVWVTPTDGCTFSSDNMLIPLGAAHKYTAEKWMDWYYKPEIAAQLTAYVQYVSPVKGTKEEIAKIDESLASDPFIFPDAALEAQLNVFAGLSEEDEIYMNDAFSALQGN
ncbi:MAG: spermidine/putrescine ABC transporter substrate-binding protein [Candidatus Aquidulcis sp.]|nr:MAG: spermidine/putrescine ABC transporter substrate-binding protein [Candidatus Aquidulcis sp.]